jgi:hypothetical protein
MTSTNGDSLEISDDTRRERNARNGRKPPSNLAELCQNLRRASLLLIEPRPETITEVAAILEESQDHLRSRARLNPQVNLGELRNVETELRRVRSLLEGALRVQWSQMRVVLALTQYYAPGGKTLQWAGASPQVDLKV